MGGLCANPNPVVWAVRTYPVSTDRRIHDDSPATYESVDESSLGIGPRYCISIARSARAGAAGSDNHPHFADQLPLPPPTPKATPTSGFTGDYYEIAEGQKTQQKLPAGFMPTTVWAFGPRNSSATSDDFFYPAHPIIAKVDKPVRVKWINDLVDSQGNFIAHPLPIKRDEHLADPSGLCEGRKTPPDCAGSPKGQYTGPVPTIKHLHGAHTTSNSDGIPEAWYLPAGGGAVVPYSRGSDWSQISGTTDGDGAAVFEYPNDPPPALLFFHDHRYEVIDRINIRTGLHKPPSPSESGRMDTAIANGHEILRVRAHF